MRGGPISAMGELARDGRGATAIEYGLLAALMAVMVIGSLTMFGDAMADLYTYYTDAIAAVVEGG